MKGGSSGTVKLLISILTLLAFHFLYFKIFNTSAIGYDLARFLEYILGIIIIYFIYRKDLKHIKPGYGRGIINTLIYSVSCFICLVLITVFVSKWFNIPTNLVNYFNVKMSFNNILTIIEECLFIPFLISAIFVLGFSLILKKSIFASIASGVVFGVLNGLYYGFGNNLILPVIIMIFLTILYRTNHNIWSVIITYSMYLLLGVYAYYLFV